MQCLSAPDVLDAFGLSNASELTVDQLEFICPAVLTQVLLPTCPYMTPSAVTIDPEGERAYKTKSFILRFQGYTSFYQYFHYYATCPFDLCFSVATIKGFYYMNKCGIFFLIIIGFIIGLLFDLIHL